MTRRESGARTGRGCSRGLCVLVLALPLAVGCRPEGPAAPWSLRHLVAASSYDVGEVADAGLVFASEPEVRSVEAEGETRPAVVTDLHAFSWSGEVPEGARLELAARPLGEIPDGALLELSVELREGSQRRVLEVARGGASRDRWSWARLSVPLPPGFVDLRIGSRLEGADGEVTVAWAPARVTTGHRATARPNVILVVIDTLRFDRLGPYGATRPTSPRIEAWLAEPGVVVDRAYAQAPWTLPSVASLLSGRWPHETVGRSPTGFDLTRLGPVLAEELAAAGYETAGFIANPVLHRGNGFGRGFATFFSPPDVDAAFELHADSVGRRAQEFLSAQGDRPFFLYLHLLDPHDPYESPESRGNRSPFEAEPYTGPITGRHVHGIYLGRVELPDPPRDLAHLSALYDAEVLYADRWVGEVLEALPRALRGETLFVLTSDHGEELFEHGGWKHGRTVYEEQIHVPLLLRWDGRFPAGARWPGPARLIDVAPTILGAAGIEPPSSWDGRDLGPAIVRGQSVPEPSLYAEMLHEDGPIRATVREGRWKLLLFDRYGLFQPANGYQEMLWRSERERLPRIALFDLDRDPGEREDLAAENPELVARLGDQVLEQVAVSAPGPLVVARGLPEGGEVEVRFVVAPTTATVEPRFLGPADRLRRDGGRIELRMVGEAVPKGLELGGDLESIAALEVLLDGEPLTPVVGSGDAPVEDPIGLEALRVDSWPPVPEDGPTVQVFLLPLRRPAAAAADPETVERLRALGYL